MIMSPSPQPSTAKISALREEISSLQPQKGLALPFGVTALDDQLVGKGLDVAALHEIAAATATLSDDAAATLFVAGLAARFARRANQTVLWIVTQFDLYAPGLEQVGLKPCDLIYAQGHKDREVLALAEDGLKSGVLACVVAEVKAADRSATRRLQLAAADGSTPMLLYRRHRTSGRCPLDMPSSAMTRWRIGTLSSAQLAVPGVGRGRWAVELVRQRNGNSFFLELEACDDTGRLALPASTRDRTATPRRATEQGRAASHAA